MSGCAGSFTTSVVTLESSLGDNIEPDAENGAALVTLVTVAVVVLLCCIGACCFARRLHQGNAKRSTGVGGPSHAQMTEMSPIGTNSVQAQPQFVSAIAVGPVCKTFAFEAGLNEGFSPRAALSACAT
eukprot:SAG11_NODE_13059_length_672_cov_0.631763_1_plen_127_part_01